MYDALRLFCAPCMRTNRCQSRLPAVPSPSADSSDATVSSKRERKTGDSKTTRVRTVLNEKQLHTLRTCYNANPRPDALMKEQLVEMTGLSPRVVRVWFQNKRCKDKKREIYLKQMQEQGKVSRRPRGLASCVTAEFVCRDTDMTPNQSF